MPIMTLTDVAFANDSENPFNYDENDLDLDQFCLMIQRELHEITAVSSLRRTSYLLIVN